MKSFPGECRERRSSIADTLLYANEDPDKMATVAIMAVPVVWSSVMGLERAALTMIKTLVAIQIAIAGTIDFLGLKNDADIDIIGEATKSAF